MPVWLEVDRRADLETASTTANASEVERQVDPYEPRPEDRRRVQPRSAIRGDVVILRLEGGPVIRVQQVLQVEADVCTPAAEPHDFRKPHVDLRPAIVGNYLVGVVDQRDGRGAVGKAARRKTPENALHDRVRHLPVRVARVDGRLDPDENRGIVRREDPRRLRAQRGTDLHAELGDRVRRAASEGRLDRIDGTAIPRVRAVDLHDWRTWAVDRAR